MQRSLRKKTECTMMKQIIAALNIFLLLALLSSCNTIEGVGRDVESVGSTIEETAKDSK